MLSTASKKEAQKGWHAELELGFEKRPARTVLSRRRRKGPLSVQRAFYPEDDVCHVYLLHPPGGVVGGDRLDIKLHLDAGSHALLTTPGATKFYRSAGETAVQHQVFDIKDNAMLEWLPQENIFFPGSMVKNSLRLNLEGNARAAAWDIQCFGRPVIEEIFDEGYLDNHWQVYRDDRPILIERLRVDKDRINAKAQLDGHAVSGSFIMTNFDRSLLHAVREKTFSGDTERLAVTVIDDLLITRYLGNSTENARRCFAGIWSLLRKSCFNRQAVVPRIWNT